MSKTGTGINNTMSTVLVNFGRIAQLVERHLEAVSVPGSSPGLTIIVPLIFRDAGGESPQVKPYYRRRA
jgi:hypothetical protein